MAIGYFVASEYFLMLYKITILFALILVALHSNGQDGTFKVLQLRKQKYYTEKNYLQTDSSFSAIQEVCYDEPHTFDEEHCLILTLNFLDTFRARRLQTIILPNDSSVLQCKWDLRSIWAWEAEHISINGTVHVVSMTKESMALDLDLRIVYKRFNGFYVYLYKGRRKFGRSKEKE